MGVKLISLQQALEICLQYEKSPQTTEGIKYAGKKFNFAWKSKDKIHWQVDKNLLIKYLKLLQKPTQSSLAKKLNCAPSWVYFARLHLGIKIQYNLGVKFLKDDDVKKIIQYHQTNYNKRGSYEKRK